MTQKLSVEELLKPRYKVIAGFPSSRLEIGKILTLEGSADDKDGFELYPHLFKKLEWWEDRKPEYMPQYVKHGENGKPRKVNRIYRDCLIEFVGGRTRKLNSKYLPATEAEYLTFLNQQQ